MSLTRKATRLLAQNKSMPKIARISIEFVREVTLRTIRFLKVTFTSSVRLTTQFLNSQVSFADDSGINETSDTHEGEFNGEPHSDKEFAKPFPPPSARGSYGIRPHGYLSNTETDLNPNSPSVSVHIVNVPSPLALQQTR